MHGRTMRRVAVPPKVLNQKTARKLLEENGWTAQALVYA
jgi:hypothetical protein